MPMPEMQQKEKSTALYTEIRDKTWLKLVH